MLTQFQAQVGFYNGLPCFSTRRLFSGVNQRIFDLTKALAKRLQEQVVLVLEMLVKPPVRQAGVFHNGRNRGAI